MSRIPPADPKTLSPQKLTEAAVEMERVLVQHPQLGDFGFGVYDPRGKTAAERAAALVKERNDIRSPSALAAFAVARAWLRQHSKRKTINKTGGSYSLKHVAENDIGYITNGVFIAAAVAEGFRVVRIDYTPNAWFNISATAWKRAAT